MLAVDRLMKVELLIIVSVSSWVVDVPFDSCWGGLQVVLLSAAVDNVEVMLICEILWIQQTTARSESNLWPN